MTAQREYSWKRERELLNYATDCAQEVYRRLRQGEYTIYNLAVGDLSYSISRRAGGVWVYVYHKERCVLCASLDRRAETCHTALWKVEDYVHGDWACEHNRQFRPAAEAAIRDLRMRKFELMQARLDQEEAKRLRRMCFEEDVEESVQHHIMASRRAEDMTDWFNALPDLEAAVELGEDGAAVRWCASLPGGDDTHDPFSGDTPRTQDEDGEL